jgi:hypothetical protein
MKIIITESQYRTLLESIDKNKKLINNIIGFDFSDRITQITSSYDVPKVFFDNVIHPRTINQWLNYWGPMYLFELDGTKYLYQDKGDYEYFLDQEGYEYMDDEIHEKIGIDLLGLKFSDIINMYFEEEES